MLLLLKCALMAVRQVFRSARGPGARDCRLRSKWRGTNVGAPNVRNSDRVFWLVLLRI